MKSGTKVRILGEIAKFVPCFFVFESQKLLFRAVLLVKVQFIFGRVTIENLAFDIFLSCD